jgi:hypothetical protein
MRVAGVKINLSNVHRGKVVTVVIKAGRVSAGRSPSREPGRREKLECVKDL